MEPAAGKKKGAAKAKSGKSDATLRSRHWGWTLFPETFDTKSIFNPRGKPDWVAFADYLKTSVEEGKAAYCVFETELAPETQKLHYQGYCQFEQPISLKQLKEVLDNNTVHCWIPNGTAEENRAYCLKGPLKDDPTYAGFHVELGVFGLCAQGTWVVVRLLFFHSRTMNRCTNGSCCFRARY